MIEKNEKVTLKYSWQMLKGMWPNLLLVAALITALIIFHLSIMQMLYIIISMQIITAIYKYVRYKEFNLKKFLLGMVQTIIIFGLLMAAYYYLGAYSLWGIFAFFVLYSFWLLWRGRKLFMKAIRDIEYTVWGKSLDRKKWKKGEMKNTKVKMVWKK